MPLDPFSACHFLGDPVRAHNGFYRDWGNYLLGGAVTPTPGGTKGSAGAFITGSWRPRVTNAKGMCAFVLAAPSGVRLQRLLKDP